MPTSKEVTVLIHRDGRCSVDAVNFTDASCIQATQQILQVLAGAVLAEHLKPEAQRLPPQALRQEAGR